MIRTLFLAGLLLFSGCASLNTVGVVLSVGEEQSLAEIKKAIVGVMGEPRALSENQREFTSQYFSRKSDISYDPEKSKERCYSTMLILGARRPYEVEIRTFVEKKAGMGFQPHGEDEKTSKRLAFELQAKLNQSRDGHNLIDDFKAF